jgi:hypothetical protein
MGNSRLVQYLNRVVYQQVTEVWMREIGAALLSDAG